MASPSFPSQRRRPIPLFRRATGRPAGPDRDWRTPIHLNRGRTPQATPRPGRLGYAAVQWMDVTESLPVPWGETKNGYAALTIPPTMVTRASSRPSQLHHRTPLYVSRQPPRPSLPRRTNQVNDRPPAIFALTYFVGTTHVNPTVSQDQQQQQSKNTNWFYRLK